MHATKRILKMIENVHFQNIPWITQIWGHQSDRSPFLNLDSDMNVAFTALPSNMRPCKASLACSAAPAPIVVEDVEDRG